MHLHGDFETLEDVYQKDSFRNSLPDKQYEKTYINTNFLHLYSTAITTYSGNYKQYKMNLSAIANEGIDKLAKAYLDNPDVTRGVDSWGEDVNDLVARLGAATKLRIENPDFKFQEAYPVQQLANITGELSIIGLSPFNDKHLFEIINDSNITNCTFYYYDKSESSIIAQFIGKKNLEFKDVSIFWKDIDGALLRGNHKHIKSPKKNKKVTIKKYAKKDFAKFCEIFKNFTYSIMSDMNIVNQFNNVPYDTRLKILDKIKHLKMDRTKMSDQQFVLQAVDYHIVASEYNLDPAVICCIGADGGKNQKFMLV